MAGSKPLWRIWTMNLVGKDQFGRWTGSVVADINDKLERLFQRVQRHPSCPYHAVRCFPYHVAAQLDPGEVLIYFTTRRTNLVMRNGAPNLGPGGTTWQSQGGMISEIYVDGFLSNGDYLQQAANLAFHEAMHNKIDADKPRDIVHAEGSGLATGNQISGATQLSDANIRMMAANMARSVPQFEDAFHGIMIVDGMPYYIDSTEAPGP